MARILILAAVVLVVVLVWLNLPTAKTDTSSASNNADQALPDSSPEGTEPAPSSTNNNVIPSGSQAQNNPYENAAVKAQIRQVADLYAQASKYPHYSQPITNPEEFKEPEPFEDTEVDTPFPEQDEPNPVRLLLATEKYQYFHGEPIRARLRLLNVNPDAVINATGTIATADSDTPLTSQFVPSNVAGEYFAQFDTNLVSPSQMAPEMLLKAVVEIDQSPLFTTLGFRYQAAEAQLSGVAWSRPEAEYLVIALQYSVNRAGYYFANGVLADAESGRPLIQLQGEGRMQQGNDLLYLQAHAQALRAAGSEGPYILRSVRGYRGAERGETFDKPTDTLLPEYPVLGYSFDQYDQSEYVDPQAEERAEFLRELGSLDDDSNSDQN